MLKRILLLAFTFTLSLAARAHEGHDHGPGTAQAPKGGVLRSLETVHLELLTKGSNIRIFPYSVDLQPEEASKFPVRATVALPRKKPEKLALVAKGDHWEGEFDAKGAHRYTLELTITQGGHNDTVKYTVEPKK